MFGKIVEPVNLFVGFSKVLFNIGMLFDSFFHSSCRKINITCMRHITGRLVTCVFIDHVVVF